MSRVFRHSASRVRVPSSWTGLRFVLTLLYLTLGVSAAWHAPHFSRGDIAIGSDRHESHEPVNGDACALCTVKNAPHQADASAVPFVGAGAALQARLLAAEGTRAHFCAFRARGPPALLS